jgi:hypothetical protein
MIPFTPKNKKETYCIVLAENQDYTSIMQGLVDGVEMESRLTSSDVSL